MKNNVGLVAKIFWLHYFCNPPPAESRGMNKTNGHYLYPPCRHTDLEYSELCVVIVVYFNKEMFNS